MLAMDREALICDLAETYGIFDYRALPARLLATLAVGLRDNSRIKMRMEGQHVPRGELLLAAILDRVSTIAWFLSEDGQNNVNRPASMVAVLLGDAPSQNSTIESFATAEEYEQEWQRRTGVAHG